MRLHEPNIGQHFGIMSWIRNQLKDVLVDATVGLPGLAYLLYCLFCDSIRKLGFVRVRVLQAAKIGRQAVKSTDFRSAPVSVRSWRRHLKFAERDTISDRLLQVDTRVDWKRHGRMTAQSLASREYEENILQQATQLGRWKVEWRPFSIWYFAVHRFHACCGFFQDLSFYNSS